MKYIDDSCFVAIKYGIGWLELFLFGLNIQY